MFRSGTTFIAKTLNSHKNFTIASDAFFSAFKFLRNDFLNIKNYHEPFDDYLYSSKKIKIFDKLQKMKIKEVNFIKNYEKLKKVINKDISNFSPELKNKINLDKNKIRYSVLFKKIFRELFKINKNKYIGIKEVWLNEFIPVLNDHDKNFKYILIIRDPRAVIASNFASSEAAYPIIFLIKQWKKIVNLSFFYKNKYPKKVHIILYENLITKPQYELKKLSKFLGVNVVTSLQKDPLDNWVQNSSYKTTKKKFNQSSLKKWKVVLKKNEILFIEKYCYLEMMHLKYKPNQQNKKKIITNIKIPKPRNKKKIWISPFIKESMNKDFLYFENKKYKYLRMKKKIDSKLFYNKFIYNLHEKLFEKYL